MQEAAQTVQATTPRTAPTIILRMTIVECICKGPCLLDYTFAKWHLYHSLPPSIMEEFVGISLNRIENVSSLTMRSTGGYG